MVRSCFHAVDALSCLSAHNSEPFRILTESQTRLETYTFPCEAKFAELDFARDVYSKSVRRHLMNGTTTCSYFATLHLEASKVRGCMT